LYNGDGYLFKSRNDFRDMTLSNSEIQERIDEGAIRCLVTLEVAGKPPEHVEKSLSDYLKQLNDEKKLDVLHVEQESAIELEGDNEGFFSAYAEVEMLVPSLDAVTQIAFLYTPASIEILEPEDLNMESRDLQNWINDLLSHLHTVALELRGERQKGIHLNESIVRLLQNFVSVLLTTGPKDAETLRRMTGLELEPITRILNKLKEEKVISEDNGTWTLNSSKK